MEMIQQPIVSTTTTNNKRKEDGKKLKRQRIEQAGGKRPRTSTTTNNDNNTVIDVDATTDNTDTNRPSSTSNSTTANNNSRRMGFGIMSNSKMNNKKQNSNDKSDSTILKQLRTSTSVKDSKTQKNTSGSNSTNHRFGRVMDISPCINQSRYSTVSIAIPGSIVSYCQTRELKTILCGQIARAATIYHIDEIIIYNDNLSNNNTNTSNGMDLFRKNNDSDTHTRKFGNNSKDSKDNKSSTEENTDDTNKDSKNKKIYEPLSDSITFMARILQYCECPQYLRRNFFPMHTDLQFVGLLPPIDPPHHVRIDDYQTKYREGIVLTEKYIKDKFSLGKLVHCGLRGRPILIDQKLPPGVRCTVQMDLNSIDSTNTTANSNKQIKGTVVSPSTPREDNGTYWGYTVRIASSLQECFLNCPFSTNSNSSNNGYDLTIGTSERGTINLDDPTFITKLSSLLQSKNTGTNNSTGNKNKKKNTNKQEQFKNTTSTNNPYYKHALIVFGGVAGIEECVDADESMKLSGVDSYKLFDIWLNICQYQGSKTIRTEEAVLIALAKLHNPLLQYSTNTPPPDEEDDEDTDTDDDDDNVEDNDNDDNDDDDDDGDKNNSQTEDSNNSDEDDDDDNDDKVNIADSKNAVLDDDDTATPQDIEGSDNDNKSEISDESSSDGNDNDDDQNDDDSIVNMKE